MDITQMQLSLATYCALAILLPVCGTFGYRVPVEGSCGIEPVVITVTPPPQGGSDCEPTKVMSFKCKGTCLMPQTWHADVASDCCQPSQKGTQVVHLTCERGTLLHVPIEHPVECACQRCGGLSNALPISFLRTLIEETRKDYEGNYGFRNDLG